MANGVSGTRNAGGGGTISAAKASELENLHQKTLDSLKAQAGGDDWDKGYESGARNILSRLTGKDYSVSGYQLKQTGSSTPMSVSEVEAYLDDQIKGYAQTNHSSWNDGYYSAAVKMLEDATGNKYSVSGYKLTKKASTSSAPKAKTKSTNPPAAVKKNFSTGWSSGSIPQSVFNIATKDKSFYNSVTKPFINKVKNGTASNDTKSWVDNVFGKAMKKYNTANNKQAGLYLGERNKWIAKLKEYYGLD